MLEIAFVQALRKNVAGVPDDIAGKRNIRTGFRGKRSGGSSDSHACPASLIAKFADSLPVHRDRSRGSADAVDPPARKRK